MRFVFLGQRKSQTKTPRSAFEMGKSPIRRFSSTLFSRNLHNLSNTLLNLFFPGRNPLFSLFCSPFLLFLWRFTSVSAPGGARSERLPRQRDFFFLRRREEFPFLYRNVSANAWTTWNTSKEEVLFSKKRTKIRPRVYRQQLWCNFTAGVVPVDATQG